MSGHSKWATIKRAKAKEDAKKSKVFTRLIRELTVAARMGGGDPNGNPRLRDAISKSQAANMPKDTLMRAVSRGAGGEEGTNLEEIIYEGYGAAGVAVVIECMTDNKNRTVGEVRHAFSKHGQSKNSQTQGGRSGKKYLHHHKRYQWHSIGNADRFDGVRQAGGT